MNYHVKLSSKNQITLPVDLLKNINVKAGDILVMSTTPFGVKLDSVNNVKQRALDHMTIRNPYKISKKVIQNLNLKGAYEEMALRRYKRFEKQNKKT